MKSKMYISLFLLLLTSPLIVSAQGVKGDEEKEKVNLGNIAGGGDSARGGSIDFAGSGPEQETVVGGSLSKKNSTTWTLKLSNNTQKQKSYNASVEVKCFDKNQRSLGTKYYSYSLSPGEKADRDLTVSHLADSCMMNLVKVKDTSTKEKKGTEAAAEVGTPSSENSVEQPS